MTADQRRAMIRLVTDARVTRGLHQHATLLDALEALGYRISWVGSGDHVSYMLARWRGTTEMPLEYRKTYPTKSAGWEHLEHGTWDLLMSVIRRREMAEW